jgi:uncharacterized protein (DUF1697 family)
MTQYALLLRGINVGTKNALPMADLRSILSKIGCLNVQTYIQSGNAVFDTKLTTAALVREIEAELKEYMGRPIATVLRNHAQMKAIIAANPFDHIATNHTHLCVSFLSQAPSKSELAPLDDADFMPERYKVIGQEIYTWHPNGQGRSPLAVALSKLRLRGTMTTRNWKTVTKLAEMLK